MIYETHGRAQEYFELACNPYPFCEHACRYCYAADVIHKTADEFFRRGVPRPRVLEEVAAEARRLAKRGERRHILLEVCYQMYLQLLTFYHIMVEITEPHHMLYRPHLRKNLQLQIPHRIF